VGFSAALAASFATAAADTLCTELGPLYGRRAVLLPSLRAVTPGSDGAVSLQGTLLGLAGAAFIAALALATQFVPVSALPLIVIGAGVGSVVESILGAQTKIALLRHNEVLNLLNTAVGALFAGYGVWLMGR